MPASTANKHPAQANLSSSRGWLGPDVIVERGPHHTSSHTWGISTTIPFAEPFLLSGGGVPRRRGTRRSDGFSSLTVCGLGGLNDKVMAFCPSGREPCSVQLFKLTGGLASQRLAAPTNQLIPSRPFAPSTLISLFLPRLSSTSRPKPRSRARYVETIRCIPHWPKPHLALANEKTKSQTQIQHAVLRKEPQLQSCLQLGSSEAR
ncbi:hypothetical protein GE09DRAFT_116427 [Coniochaeta sp. 2T2.1]|nr:hypothetical protein GE09DRAFT_116427 [Coniochaeta sp. 2T2.1]